MLYGVGIHKGDSGSTVHCTMAVQYHCNSVGYTMGGGDARRIDSRTKALK